MIKALAKPKPIAEQPAVVINIEALIARCERRAAAGHGVLPTLHASVRGYGAPPGSGPGGQAGRRCSSRALVSLILYLKHPAINFVVFEIQWK